MVFELRKTLLTFDLFFATLYNKITNKTSLRRYGHEGISKICYGQKTGLKYELYGDYYILAGEDKPEREPIGVWGQRHLEYIQKYN